jgi:hypothetical protein
MRELRSDANDMQERRNGCRINVFVFMCAVRPEGFQGWKDSSFVLKVDITTIRERLLRNLGRRVSMTRQSRRHIFIAIVISSLM